jgi:hypothetical protein
MEDRGEQRRAFAPLTIHTPLTLLLLSLPITQHVTIMSLETLNNPALIAISGAAAAAGGPVLASAVLHTAPMTVRTLAAAAYSLNLYATQQPGRIDGMQGISTPNTSVRIDKDLLKNIAAYDSRRGTSLLAPKGYAFGIWAPIFLGELIFCASITTIGSRDSASFEWIHHESSVSSIVDGFVSTQTSQRQANLHFKCHAFWNCI